MLCGSEISAVSALHVSRDLSNYYISFYGWHIDMEYALGISPFSGFPSTLIVWLLCSRGTRRLRDRYVEA